ncbi:MAG: cation transporter dimerization domain-containing protein, partial [Gammaproteobacteria bacterium]
EWLKVTRNAELVVVLGEDIAAQLGLLLALMFLGISALTNDPLYDALGSICIGAVLIVVSIFVALRMRSLIIGRSAEPEMQAQIDQLIAEDPAIDRLFNTITFQMGPKVMLAAKIAIRPGTPIEDAVEHINSLERRLKNTIPEIGWCFIEPDNAD